LHQEYSLLLYSSAPVWRSSILWQSSLFQEAVEFFLISFPQSDLLSDKTCYQLYDFLSSDNTFALSKKNSQQLPDFSFRKKLQQLSVRAQSVRLEFSLRVFY